MPTLYIGKFRKHNCFGALFFNTFQVAQGMDLDNVRIENLFVI